MSTTSKHQKIRTLKQRDTKYTTFGEKKKTLLKKLFPPPPPRAKDRTR